MSTPHIAVASLGSSLPRRAATAEAVAKGHLPAGLARRVDLASVSIAPGLSGAELAAQAAMIAAQRDPLRTQDAKLLLHANVYYQGHDLWPAAAYIQRELGHSTYPAMEIRQMSNGGMAALELAATVLAATAEPGSVILTTGDAFAEPGVDRWASDPGTVFGDGGTALILTNRGGFARLRSITSFSDPELEGMHRGNDPFGTFPFSVRQPMDFEGLKKAFHQRSAASASVQKVAQGQRAAVDGALEMAGVAWKDLRWFILPHFGRRRFEAGYLAPQHIGAEATNWSFARTVGHLGAGDQFASLEFLASSGRFAVGDLVLLQGVGAGFTWSAAVLEILEQPPWAPQ